MKCTRSSTVCTRAISLVISALKNDPYLGYIISGEYDFGNGDWNNDYIVTDLLESGSMIWTAKDDDNDVSKYVRCEKVPASIIEEAKVDKD